MKAAVIVNKLLEAEDNLSDEEIESYLKTDYSPRYQKQSVDLSDAMFNDDRKLHRVFSWLTKIGAAPKFGTLPIHYYQQDQFKAIDAIQAAAKRKGIPVGWARYRNGKILMFHAGKWVPIARMDYGTITPV